MPAGKKPNANTRKMPGVEHKAVNVQKKNVSAAEVDAGLDKHDPAALKTIKKSQQSKPLDSPHSNAEKKVNEARVVLPTVRAGEMTLQSQIKEKLRDAKKGNKLGLTDAEARYCLENPDYVRSVDHPIAAFDLNEDLMRNDVFAANMQYMFEKGVEQLDDQSPWGLTNQNLINEAANMSRELARLYLQQLYGITNVDNVITSGVYAPVQVSGQQHAFVPRLAQPLVPISEGVNDQIDDLVKKIRQAAELIQEITEQAGDNIHSKENLDQLWQAKKQRSLQRKEIRGEQHDARVLDRARRKAAIKDEREKLNAVNKHEGEEDREEKQEWTEDVMEIAEKFMQARLEAALYASTHDEHGHLKKQ